MSHSTTDLIQLCSRKMQEVIAFTGCCKPFSTSKHGVVNSMVEDELDAYKREILKSRDITLPTKVRLVKAMVYPVVVYGCESWTVKKAEH